MGQKTINVIYKVDDSALTAAKAKVQDVAAATKQSESAMLAYSQSVTKSGMVISQTLEGQKLQLAQIKAQIDLTKQSDTERLNRLKADYDQVKAKIDQFNASMKTTQNQAQSSIGVFQNLQQTIAAAFSVAAIKQVSNMYLEMNRLAGQVEGVDRGFKKAFPNAVVLLEDLRKHTHGTINDFTLMQRTLQASNLGVSVEHLGVLFEFAATRAQQTGESVDYLVDSIVRGIGLKSVLRLDNLGLSAQRLKEELGGVSVRTADVGRITEVVAKIAKEENEKMGGYAVTTATKVDQLNTSWETLKQTISKRAASSGTVDFFDQALEYMNRGFQSVKEINDEFNNKYASGDVRGFLNTKPTVEAIQKEIVARKERLEMLRKEKTELTQKVFGKNEVPEVTLGPKEFEAKQVINSMKETLAIRETSIDLLKAELQARQKDSKAVEEETGYINNLNKEIEDLNNQIKEAPFEKLGSLQQKLDQKKKQLDVAGLIRPVGDNEAKQAVINELKKDASDEAQVIAQAQQTVNEDAEKSYQDGLQILKDADQERRNQLKSDKDKENQIAKEAADRELEIEKQKQRYKQQLQQAFEDFALNSSARILQNLFIDRQLDQQDLTQYYQDQIDSAGNNAQARKEIEKKVAAEKAANDAAFRQQQIELDKENAIKNIEIQTAVGIAKTFAEFGFPAGVPFAALLAAQAAIEILTVKSVQSRSLNTRAFAKGEVGIDGPGTTTSDSIPAWLSKGESVINAQATAESRNLLESINDRKLNDRILNSASQGVRIESLDLEPLLAKLDELKQPSFALQGMTLIEARSKGDNFKRYVRSKVQGY